MHPKILIVLIGFFGFIAASFGRTADEVNTSQIHSSSIVVNGKKLVCCGSEMSSISGVYKVTYENRDITWGSQVFIDYGFKKTVSGSEGRYDEDWYVKGEMEMQSVGPWLWQAEFDQILRYATYGTVLSDLQFYIKIINAQGEISYDKGNASALGFYQAASLISPASETRNLAMCQDEAIEEDGSCNLKLTTIIRNAQ